MTRFGAFILSVFLTVFGIGHASATETDDAKVSGLSAVIVDAEKRIVYLDELADTFENCIYAEPGRQGYWLNIDWGDGSSFSLQDGPAGENCAQQIVHRYRFPGTYEITYSSAVAGPTDAPEYTSEATASVTVGGTTFSGATALKLLDIPDKAVQRHPTINVQVSPGEPLTLTMEVADLKRRLYARTESDVIAAPIIWSATPQEIVPTMALLSRTLGEQMWVRVVAHSAATGETIGSTGYNSYLLSAERSPQQRSLKRVDLLKGRAVALEMQASFRKCFAYEVDWNDGTIDRHEPPTSDNCRGWDRGTVSFEHEYSRSGSYRVIVRYVDGPGPLEFASQFETIEIDVE